MMSLFLCAPLLAMYEPMVLGQMNLEVTNNTQKKYWVSIYVGCGRVEHPLDPAQRLQEKVSITERNYHCDYTNYCSQVVVIDKALGEWKDQLTIEVAYKNAEPKRQFGTNLLSHPTGEHEKKQPLGSKYFDTLFPQAHDFVTRVSLKGENLEESTMEVTKSASLSFSQMSIRSTAHIILQDRMSLKEAKTKLPAEVFEQAIDWMEKTNSAKLHQLMLAYLKS